MTGKRPWGNARPVSDLAAAVIDPLLRRRAGITVGLVQSWEEIVGERLAISTRPQKISWPRRLHEDDPFQPATLVIACNGHAALHVQHEADEIIARVNAFMGFAAIARVKIVQKQVEYQTRNKPQPRALSNGEAARLEAMIEGVEDDELRASLARLGHSVMLDHKEQ